MSVPLISICIPVYNSEQWLEDCLCSICKQDVKEIEVLVLSDCSSGQNEKGWNCKKIVKNFRKSVKFPVHYLEHSQNKGLVETRRDLCYSSCGKYVFMMDSDDMLAENSLTKLLQIAQQMDCDIVHGASENFTTIKDGKINFTEFGNKNRIFEGCLYNQEIFQGFLENNYSIFLWGKLYKRELLLEAFDLIPYTYCNMAENLVIYFFISLLAKSYCGINQVVYHYRQNSGMTSNRRIETLDDWKQICSASSVFTIIFNWRREQMENSGNDPLTREENVAVQKYAVKYIDNNLHQLENFVAPELKEAAYSLLCDYWGENLVKKVESMINQK